MVAVALGVQIRELDEIRRRLVAVNLIGPDMVPLAWEELQFTSDTSRDRVRKYRAKRQSIGLSAGSEGYQKHYAALMDRDGQSCIYCRATDNLCIDHMVPIAQGGTDEIDNLAIACKACNSGKAGRTPKEAGYKILSKQARMALTRYVTVTVTGQETDTESDKEITPKGVCASDDAHAFTVSDFVEGWNEVASACGLSQLRKLTEARKRAFRVRQREYPRIEDWQSAFRTLESNSWMHGDNKTGWRADPDFFLQAKSFTKLVEGAYDGKAD
jgi:hypothetical protein